MNRRNKLIREAVGDAWKLCPEAENSVKVKCVCWKEVHALLLNADVVVMAKQILSSACYFLVCCGEEDVRTRWVIL